MGKKDKWNRSAPADRAKHAIVMARRRYVPKALGVSLDDPAVMEYVEFLTNTGTERSSINFWLRSDATRKSPELSAVEHFSVRCRPHSFGKWAMRIANSNLEPVPEYVQSLLRASHRDAAPADKVRGLYYILADEYPEKTKDIEGIVGAECIDMETLVNRVLGGGRREMERKRFIRVLDSLRLIGANAAADDLQQMSNLTVIDRTEPGQEPQTIAPESPAVRQDNSDIGGIVLRAEDADTVNSLVRNSQAVVLTADAAYLAAELTEFPIWKAFIEKQISVPNEGVQLDVAKIRVASTRNSLVVTYGAATASQELQQVHIPRDGANRYHPNTLEHTAVVLLNYLFAETDCLVTTSAVHDVQFVDQNLSGTNESIAALYRPSGRHFAVSGKRHFIVKRESRSPRRGHSVRGHFRTGNDTKYPGKPHRRER